MIKFVAALALVVFAGTAFAADMMLTGGCATVYLLGHLFDGR